MPRITGQIVIDAPVEEVFDVVADERNEPAYNPRIKRAEMIGEEPVGRGSRFVAQPRRAGEMAVEIVEYERPHRLRNVVRSRAMHVDGVLTFVERGGRTTMSWEWDVALHGLTRVLTPLLTLVGPGWERRNWVGLKRYLESGRR